MNESLAKLIVRILIRIHTFTYRWIGFFSVRAEGGLHPKHHLMRYHDFFVNNIREGDRVIDIGCGNGALAFDLSKKASRVVGVELHPKYQSYWEGRYKVENIEYRLGDATEISSNEQFNVVVLSNVLEHIENRIAFLKKIKHLAPKMLLRVPMINRDWLTLYKKELGMYYMLDQTHYIEYTLEGFKDELAQAGLSLTTYSIQFGELWATARPESSS
jgi:2-polyprenyl-3-methyl-5-hydroxy-6-metoxy-1,4-benzoquinol methylase